MQKCALSPHTTTSARCFLSNFLAGSLGLRRATSASVLSLCLGLPEVIRTALCDLPPAFPPKIDGSGILLLRQNWKSNYDLIMHQLSEHAASSAMKNMACPAYRTVK